MKTAIKQILNRFDTLIQQHEELGDTDVRDQMSDAVYHALIAQSPEYDFPSEFGMFTQEGNAAVRVALSEFVAAAREEAERQHLSTPQQRFDAFQDPAVVSDANNPYDEYFGHSDSVENMAGEVSAAPFQRPKRWWQFWR